MTAKLNASATRPETRITRSRLTPRLLRVLVGVTAAALISTTGPLAPTADAAPTRPVRPQGPTAASRAGASSTHTIGVGSNPYDVAISQSLGKAFVVNDGSVTVLSLLTRRRLEDFSTGGFQGQNAIALVRGNTEGYITNYERDEVTVFDTETHKVLRRIHVGPGPVDIAKVNTPKGQRAYIALESFGRVDVIQTSTGKVVQHIKLPHGSQALIGAPGGRSLWVGSSYDYRIHVVDTVTGKTIRSIDTGRAGPPTSIAFTPDNKHAWVAGPGGVTVINVKTGKTTKFLPIQRIFQSKAPNMGTLALTGSGRYAYVEDSTFLDTPTRGTIIKINTKTYKIVQHIQTGVEPQDLVLDTRRDIAYVPNYADDTLTYFNVAK